MSQGSISSLQTIKVVIFLPFEKPYLFTFIYLKGKVTHETSGCLLPVHSLKAGPGPAKAMNLALSPGLSCEQQGPKHLSRYTLPPRVCNSRTLQPEAEPGLKPGTLIWTVGGPSTLEHGTPALPVFLLLLFLKITYIFVLKELWRGRGEREMSYSLAHSSSGQHSQGLGIWKQRVRNLIQVSHLGGRDLSIWVSP